MILELLAVCAAALLVTSAVSWWAERYDNKHGEPPMNVEDRRET